MRSGFEHSILDIANDFYGAYLRCRKATDAYLDFGQCVSAVVNVPAIVNGIFACELYLKSMLPKEEWKQDGHNLQLLFQRLHPMRQKMLQDTIAFRLAGEEKTVDEYLELLANGFEYWRYIHESEGFGELGLNGTLRVLPAFLESFREQALSIQE